MPEKINPQAPAWLLSPVFNTAEVARMIPLTKGALANKIKSNGERYFTPTELERLEQIKEQIKILLNT